MLKILLIAAGGGAGSVLRYLMAGWVQRLVGETFPAGTLVVNMTGCLLIGVLSALFSATLIPEAYRMAVLVGVLGGFTTFSTFGLETFTLLNSGQALRALANVLLSVFVGLAAVWFGHRLGRRVCGV